MGGRKERRRDHVDGGGGGWGVGRSGGGIKLREGAGGVGGGVGGGDRDGRGGRGLTECDSILTIVNCSMPSVFWGGS